MKEILLKPSSELFNYLETLDLLKDRTRMKDGPSSSKEWLNFGCLHQLYETSSKILQKSDNIYASKFMYLHQWLESCDIEYPSPPKQIRDPVLELRIQKLRAQQEAREYKRMTANVHKESINDGNAFSIGAEVRSLRAQMFAVMNFLLTVGGTFVFGFKAVEYSSDVPSLPMQILIGFVMATIVAVAELYFVAKLI